MSDLTVTAIDYGGVRQVWWSSKTSQIRHSPKAKVAKERAKLHDVVNAMNAALCLIDRDRKILWQNRTFSDCGSAIRSASRTSAFMALTTSCNFGALFGDFAFGECLICDVFDDHQEPAARRVIDAVTVKSDIRSELDFSKPEMRRNREGWPDVTARRIACVNAPRPERAAFAVGGCERQIGINELAQLAAITPRRSPCTASRNGALANRMVSSASEHQHGRRKRADNVLREAAQIVQFVVAFGNFFQPACARVRPASALRVLCGRELLCAPRSSSTGRACRQIRLPPV